MAITSFLKLNSNYQQAWRAKSVYNEIRKMYVKSTSSDDVYAGAYISPAANNYIIETVILSKADYSTTSASFKWTYDNDTSINTANPNKLYNDETKI